MKKRKLLLTTLFLASALTLLAPTSAQASDPTQGGGEGRERPRWPPVRTASETYEPEDSINNDNHPYSAQGWWNYLVDLLT